MQKLKIAQLVLPWIPIPPPKFAGTEWIVAWLTEELQKKGHEVTLFSVGESKTSAKLEYVYEEAFGLQKDVMASLKNSFKPLIHVANCFEKANNFDIIHSHAQFSALPFSAICKTPTLHTFHRMFDFENEDEKELLLHYKDLNYSSISDSQRTLGLNFIKTVYNGIPLNKFEYSDKKDDYLLWVGRLANKKGPKEAIEVAKSLNKKLFLIGKITEEDFFNQEISPLIDKKQIIYLGEMDQKDIVNYYKKAEAFLFPIKWNEPFGLVPVEAMACGTPAIAYKNGGAKETIKDKETGFLVEEKEGVSGLIESVKSIKSISSKKCREHVEKNFSVEKMVNEYESLYYKMLEK